jgi:hypothetical protein
MQNWLERVYRKVSAEGVDPREDAEPRGALSIPLNWLRYVGRRHSRVMSPDERDYFRDRAAEEMTLAREARHPDAVRSHSMLAAYYLDLVQCASRGPEELVPSRS